MFCWVSYLNPTYFTFLSYLFSVRLPSRSKAATIHCQNGDSDKRSIVGSKKSNRGGNLFRLSNSTYRMACRDALAHLWIAQPVLGQRRFDNPWADAINADVFAGVSYSHMASQVDNSAGD